MKAGQFNKTSGRKQAKPKPGKAPAHKKTAPPGDGKIPAMRIGPDLSYHDVHVTKVYYVLVDGPKEPEDSVVLVQPPQTFPMAPTTDAQPLSNSIFTFALAFDKVRDGGTLTLKLERGASRAVAELFTNVRTTAVMLDDVSLMLQGPYGGDQAGKVNLRMLDSTTIKARPFCLDRHLDQFDEAGHKEAPHSSLGKSD